MSLFTKTAEDTFAPYDSAGNPREIIPQEAQVWGAEVERALLSFQAGGGIIFETKTEMDTTLTYAANQMAWVIGDPTVANNGIYRKTGASGIGSWVRLGDLPYSFIKATDVGAGTPNAIHAATSIPVSGSALIWMNVFEANTASPVTVSFNGGAALPIKTNSGNDVTAGGLTAGMIVMGIVSGSTFRLVSDQVSAAIIAQAEAAAAAAEAAASSIVEKQFVSLAQAQAATISALTKRIQTQFRTPLWADSSTLVGDAPYRRVSLADLSGYPASSHFRSQDRYMPDGTVDATNGGYWVLDDSRPDPFQFGARFGPILDNSFTYNSGQALEDWLWFINNVTGYGECLPGAYRCDRTLYIDSGVEIDFLGSTSAIELPWFSAASLESEEGVTFIMTGNAPKLETLDFCSSLEYGGLSRANPLRTHNNAFDAVFAATDFTNSDAVGATRATLRAFSAAIVIGKDGSSGKTRISGLRVIPECTDGINGPLAGYLQVGANAYIPWAQWDIGIYVMNGYTTHISDCQAGGFWGMKGVLQTSIRFGTATSGGRGEQCLWERCWIQGGLAIRNGDFYPITAKTANSITIPWSKGHRFTPTGTIFTNEGTFTYTALTYSAAGEGTLTFTVTGSTANIVVGGLDASFLYMTNNNGTTQTKFSDCNIRDFWHTTEVEKPSSSLGSQAGRYSATIEICGYPARGILFENNTIYDRHPLSILIQGSRDIRFMNAGTWEEKNYRATIGGAYNPSGSPQGLVICGPDNAHADSYNALMRGHVDVEGYPWSGRLNLSGRGLITGAVAGVRYSAYGDWFNPFRFTWSSRPSGDQDILYDVRLPERRIISNGSISVYGRQFQVDTEGAAAIDDLTNAVPYVIGLSELVFQTFSSSRDVVIKHLAAGDYNFYCKSGADTTLFSPITPVMFVLLGKTWYQI
ncbi:hypothetical protein I7G59_09645 [Sinorhizobium meliloti]|uniref:hypothetical protein n=1 Tax=Rhizobium meliloti TaxID=382 RepID=UPI0023809BA2|nr:hypothetical protein [Sinorhizobium meliloti]MDE3797589.1 hypothetical protein [Sinorhizobium meliloti]